MRKTIKKWAIRLSASLLLMLALLIAILANPTLLYANKKNYGSYSILYQENFDKALLNRIDEAAALLKKSELYDSSFLLQICLNDGSYYTNLVQTIFGRAFGWGFYNKIVLSGKNDFGNNYILLNGRKWNCTQLLAHEAVHCLQFNKYGLWKSNPVANIAQWKWEGYPEYVARHSSDKELLLTGITKLTETEKTIRDGWIDFSDGTGSSINYYKDWLLVLYCIDIKNMSFDTLIKDKTPREEFWQEMMNWYNNKIINANTGKNL